jgi:aminoglycoside phosphotransferase
LETLIKIQSKPHKICFTHGDAALRNIIVRKSESVEYHVAGLVDFEMSGFFPEYWEYVSAMGSEDGMTSRYWNQEIDKFLVPYPAELTLDHIRLKYFGPDGGWF